MQAASGNSPCVAHKRGKHIPEIPKNPDSALEWAAFGTTKKKHCYMKIYRRVFVTILTQANATKLTQANYGNRHGDVLTYSSTVFTSRFLLR